MFARIQKIRNLGIIAHIDGGKTTLCERFLEVTGAISKAGSVDGKNTVLDFLPIEKRRGITVNGATAQIHYNGHKINLIDLPGHIDFNVENEMAFLGIDGCICLIDSIHGVQVQTEKIFRQAKLKNIPCLFFINKMDRDGVNWRNTMKSLNSIGFPLITQAPVFNNTNYPEKEKVPSPFTQIISLVKQEHDLRSEMIDSLCNFDEDLINLVLENREITTEFLNKCIRKQTINGLANPVLFGSASKNLGVTNLLDAVVDWLPFPSVDHQHPYAVVFKIQHDMQRGFQYFVKNKGTKIMKSTELYNSRTKSKVQIQRIQRSFGRIIEEIDSIESGEIGIVTGLRNVKVGDIISSDKFCSHVELLHIPSQVFFFSATLKSKKDSRDSENAIEILQLEDPSISVDKADSSWIIGCMGELHAEILQDKLYNLSKGNFDFGPMRIKSVFKAVQSESNCSYTFSASQREYTVEYKIEMGPILKSDCFNDDDDLSNELIIEHDFKYLVEHMQSSINRMLQEKLTFKVVGTKFKLADFRFSSNYKDDTGKYNDAIEKSFGLHLANNINRFDKYEPLMNVCIESADNTGAVLADIARRKGDIISNEPITANIPLRELQGYSTKLRTLTNGKGTFTATLLKFSKVN
eukprot:NODE_70_length_23697_cov_0.294771.p3 type:complete len:635 gc:universal NODE_70_length_23697_cov_0.294771:21836-19932(-)